VISLAGKRSEVLSLGSYLVVIALLLCAVFLLHGCQQEAKEEVIVAPPRVAEEAPAQVEATPTVPEPEPEPLPPRGIIVIDPGHQGQGDYAQEPVGPGATATKARVATGTRGVVTGVSEHAINLEIGLKLRDALLEEGYEVYMVRETAEESISNAERAIRANELGADVFIRLHCDGAANPNVHGFMSLIPANSGWTALIYEESKRVSAYVHAAVLEATGAFDRGTIRSADMTGFNWAEVPSILLEMGVMTNPDEDRRLSDPEHQDKIVQGIVNGLNAFFEAEID